MNDHPVLVEYHAPVSNPQPPQSVFALEPFDLIGQTCGVLSILSDLRLNASRGRIIDGPQGFQRITGVDDLAHDQVL